MDCFEFKPFSILPLTGYKSVSVFPISMTSEIKSLIIYLEEHLHIFLFAVEKQSSKPKKYHERYILKISELRK